MIKFQCKYCDKKIRVPEDFAGKLVKCPKCTSPTRVPKLEPLREQPIEIQEQPQPKPVPQPSGTLESQPETEPETDTSEQLEYHFEDEPPDESIWPESMFDAQMPIPSVGPDGQSQITCAKCKTTLNPDTEFCINCGQAIPVPESTAHTSLAPNKNLLKSVSTGSSFPKDLLSLMAPVKSLGDGIIFFIVLLVHIFANMELPTTILIIWFAQILSKGIVFAFLFNVLLETANGGNNLPELEALTIWGLIRTYLQVLVSGFYAFSPVVICMIASLFIVGSAFMYTLGLSGQQSDTVEEQTYGPVEQNEDLSDQDNQSAEPDEIFLADEELSPAQAETSQAVESMVKVLLVIFIFLFCVGLFFWPMIVLNIVLGDKFLLNPVKIVINIVRTLKPYSICCVAIFAAAGLMFLSNAEFFSEGLGSNFALIGSISSLLGVLCIEIYAMRVLGLLFRYYEERLDW